MNKITFLFIVAFSFITLSFAHAQSLPAPCNGIQAGTGLQMAGWDVLKAAQLFCASHPQGNWSGMTLFAHEEPRKIKKGKGKQAFGWSTKNRQAHISLVGNKVSQIEILHHEIMGHLIPNAWEHDDKFRRNRMQSAVDLGWLTKEEMNRALSQDLKERVYQQWMYPRIREWMMKNNIAQND
ncbi:hypothetical protein K1X76_05820 [bacterium]|nr:hypothetical protein [bacterium]